MDSFFSASFEIIGSPALQEAPAWPLLRFILSTSWSSCSLGCICMVMFETEVGSPTAHLYYAELCAALRGMPTTALRREGTGRTKQIMWEEPSARPGRCRRDTGKLSGAFVQTLSVLGRTWRGTRGRRFEISRANGPMFADGNGAVPPSERPQSSAGARAQTWKRRRRG